MFSSNGSKMKKMLSLRHIPPALACLGLAACGGVTTPGSPPIGPVSPAAQTNGVGGSTLGGSVLSSDAVGATVTSITYDTGGGPTPFPNVIKITPDASTFGQAHDAAADGTSFDVVAFSDDGKAFHGASSVVSTTVIGSSSGTTPGFGQYAKYSRDSSSVLPTSGIGVYNGHYRGTIGADGLSYNGHTAGAVVGVQGISQLTAQFGAQTISGTISSRSTLLATGAAGTALGDVTLSSSSISSNGQFGASATDGSATGTYEGLIGGANGNGVAGALNLTHSGGFTELGVFTGQR